MIPSPWKHNCYDIWLKEEWEGGVVWEDDLEIIYTSRRYLCFMVQTHM